MAVSILESNGAPLEVKLVTVARLKFPSWLHAVYASSHVPPLSLLNAHNHKSFSITWEYATLGLQPKYGKRIEYIK